MVQWTWDRYISSAVCWTPEEAHSENPKGMAMLGGQDAKSFTNSVFLLGEYMAMRLSQKVQQLTWLPIVLCEKILTYCDGSPKNQDAFSSQLRTAGVV